MDQQQQDQVQYTTFENLQDQIIQKNDASDWKQQFIFIDSLRAQNKFHSDQFKIQEWWDQLQPLTDSIRSNVSKNALMLIKETIQHNNVFDEKILQKLFEKCESDFKFLKNEALQTIEILSQKPYSDDLIKILCNITLSQNYKLQSHSYPTLVKIVLASDFNCDWDNIIKATLAVYIGKSVECKKASDQLYLAIQKQRPEVLEKEEQLKVIGERTKQKGPQKGFKEFLQQQKK
ncbi:unnamed protein product [Paramecium primaurelia]|uniref:CLASP N-terminal domain-containing protein n=2 Tax=Paramecium TaxID=5884 RepID=A0A8S1T476_9CILI|nr:unnamed protein product [Paramecium primaurelia]CAD8146409.1 unnamed protein product [Paramecium pentaurelia]